MAIAGFKCKVKKGGTATSFSSEATTQGAAGSTTTYQVTDYTKQIFDRTLTANTSGAAGLCVTVSSSVAGQVVQTSTKVTSWNYNFGKVVLAAATTGTVKISGKYIPTTGVTAARAVGIETRLGMLDATVLTTSSTTNCGVVRRVGSLLDASVTLTELFGGTTKFIDGWNDRDEVMIEIVPGGSSGYRARGWFIPEGRGYTASPDALSEMNWTFQNEGGSTNAWFGWGT